MYFQNVLACVVRRGYAIFHRTAQLASVLHYASDAGSVELPDTRFAARKSPMDDGIAPTTLKNKARPAQRGSANQAARRGPPQIAALAAANDQFRPPADASVRPTTAAAMRTR